MTALLIFACLLVDPSSATDASVPPTSATRALPPHANMPVSPAYQALPSDAPHRDPLDAHLSALKAVESQEDDDEPGSRLRVPVAALLTATPDDGPRFAGLSRTTHAPRAPRPCPLPLRC